MRDGLIMLKTLKLVASTEPMLMLFVTVICECGCDEFEFTVAFLLFFRLMMLDDYWFSIRKRHPLWWPEISNS